MKIVALFCCYNEGHGLARSLEHLHSQGVESYIIDNDSTDDTRAIAESFRGRGVIGIERLPRRGVFELAVLMKRKEELHRELGADWYINQDADEVREAPKPYRTLAEGLEAVDAAGYTAVDFDEFVFLPTKPSDDFNRRDYIAEMRHYCYLRPQDGSVVQIRAWKNTGQEIDLVSSGGHHVQFDGLKVAPERFALRHYIALSYDLAVQKYCKRTYSQEEFDNKGWHGARAVIRQDELRLPSADELCTYIDGEDWDRSNPLPSLPLFGAAEERALQLRHRRLRKVTGLRKVWNGLVRRMLERGHRLRGTDS
ncbi:MAG: glycosyltransferase [Planctomycetota bacterium]